MITGYLGLGCVIKQVCVCAGVASTDDVEGPGILRTKPFLASYRRWVVWVTYLALPLTLPGFYS